MEVINLRGSYIMTDMLFVITEHYVLFFNWWTFLSYHAGEWTTFAWYCQRKVKCMQD